MALAQCYRKCLLVVGYHYGCRPGELRKLRWDQVALAAGEIRLAASQTKAKAPRILPIYGDVRDWLERQKSFCVGERVYCWKQVAIKTVATEKQIGSYLKSWHEACTAAGLPDLHFHDLRRSALRNMERAGIPRSIAMRISGHKTEAVYRRYDIVCGTDLRMRPQRWQHSSSRQAYIEASEE